MTERELIDRCVHHAQQELVAAVERYLARAFVDVRADLTITAGLGPDAAFVIIWGSWTEVLELAALLAQRRAGAGPLTSPRTLEQRAHDEASKQRIEELVQLYRLNEME